MIKLPTGADHTAPQLLTEPADRATFSMAHDGSKVVRLGEHPGIPQSTYIARGQPVARLIR